MTPVELPEFTVDGNEHIGHDKYKPAVLFGKHGFAPMDEEHLSALLAALAPEQRARLLHACHPLIGSVYDLLDKAQKKAEQYERDWYDAKAEFGTARATDARRIESLEKDLEDSRRMLEEERARLATIRSKLEAWAGKADIGTGLLREIYDLTGGDR